MGPLQSMSKEAALQECLKALGDKDYTLSDYREKEIILIALFKSQNIPAKVGFLFKNDSKVHSLRHKQNLISEGSPSVSRWGGGSACVWKSHKTLATLHSSPDFTLENGILQLALEQ